MVLGEDSAHTRLQDLLRYYTGSPLSPYGETLSQPLAREVRRRTPSPPPPPPHLGSDPDCDHHQGETQASPSPRPEPGPQDHGSRHFLTPLDCLAVPPLPTHLRGSPLRKIMLWEGFSRGQSSHKEGAWISCFCLFACLVLIKGYLLST